MSAGIRSLSAGNPHEHDVFTDRFGDLARRVDTLRVSVNDDFGEHFRVVAVSSASRVSCVEDGVVETIDGRVDHPNEVIGGKSSSKSIGKQS